MVLLTTSAQEPFTKVRPGLQSSSQWSHRSGSWNTGHSPFWGSSACGSHSWCLLILASCTSGQCPIISAQVSLSAWQHWPVLTWDSCWPRANDSLVGRHLFLIAMQRWASCGECLCNVQSNYYWSYPSQSWWYHSPDTAALSNSKMYLSDSYKDLKRRCSEQGPPMRRWGLTTHSFQNYCACICIPNG